MQSAFSTTSAGYFIFQMLMWIQIGWCQQTQTMV